MFKQYARTQIAELRPVTKYDIQSLELYGKILILLEDEDRLSGNGVSISDADRANGSPKIGDMIARNPENHEDQWLVAKDYFEANFGILKEM